MVQTLLEEYEIFLEYGIWIIYIKYKSRFSLIVEQVLVFASNTNLVKEVKDLSPNLSPNPIFYVIDKSY